MTFPFDASALTDPVDRATVSAHKRHLVASGRAPSSQLTAGTIAGIVIGAVVLFVFGGAFLGAIGGAVAMFADGSVALAGLAFALIPGIICLLVVAGIVFAIIHTVRGTAARWYRFDRFANANGMRWYPIAENPGLPGMIFSLGSSRKATDIIRGSEPRTVEFANYEYTTGSGKERTTHKWGYVAIRLASPLPHIVLDAVGNNALFGSNLPTSFARDQRLSLEGDFDRYFELYCPEGYERDALYLFTPDIMARFIDHAAALDVEIVDDWLFLYARREFSTLDPATWHWLFSVVGALLDKLAQWERWRDDRLTAASSATGAADALPFTASTQALRPPSGVATAGRRLQRRFPWPAVLVVAGVALVWIVTSSGLLGLFFGR